MKDLMMNLNEGVRLLERGEYGKAVSYFEDRLSLKNLRPNERAMAQISEVHALISIGRDKDAEKVLAELKKADERQLPDDIVPYILHQRARLAALRGDRREAIRLFRRELVELNSGMSGYYLRLSLNFAAQAEQFLALNDLFETEIYLKLARNYAEAGESEVALRAILPIESRYLEKQGHPEEALARSAEASRLFIKSGRKADFEREEKRVAALSKTVAAADPEKRAAADPQD